MPTALANKDVKKAEQIQSEVILEEVDTSSHHTGGVLFAICSHQPGSDLITVVSCIYASIFV